MQLIKQPLPDKQTNSDTETACGVGTQRAAAPGSLRSTPSTRVKLDVPAGLSPAASLPKSEPAPIPPPDQPTQTAGQRKLHASARGPEPGPIARAATAPRGMNLELPTPPDRRGTSTPPPTPPLTQSARPAPGGGGGREGEQRVAYG